MLRSRCCVSLLTRLHKALYAAQLLGLAAMASAKMSVAMLLDRIVTYSRRAAWFSYSAITAWALFSLFAVAFGCSLPNPWDLLFSQCSTHGAKLLYPIIIFNILTDVMLSIWVIPYVWVLKMEAKDRLLVRVLFGARLVSVTLRIASGTEPVCFKD